MPLEQIDLIKSFFLFQSELSVSAGQVILRSWLCSATRWMDIQTRQGLVWSRERAPVAHKACLFSFLLSKIVFLWLFVAFFVSHWDLFSTFISILIGQSVHHGLIGINTLVQSVIRTWMAQACRGRTDYGGWDKWWRSDVDIVRHRVRWSWKVDFFQSFAAWKAFCQRSLVANPLPAALDEYDVLACFHCSTFYWKSLNWNHVSFSSYESCLWVIFQRRMPWWPRSWHLDTRLTDPCWSFDPSTAAFLETLVQWRHPNDPTTQNPPVPDS